MRPFSVPVLDTDPAAPFPAPEQSEHPEGLVAIGGDLASTRLLNAYRNGIFPWYEPGGPILWWSPNPRAVLIPGHVHLPRRLRRTLRQRAHRVTVDRCFPQVIEHCAAPREYSDGTWITPEMKAAYIELHQRGHAHSLEVWQDEHLVGGIYGIAIGAVFFAESKFHRRRDASKIALAELIARLEQNGFLVCDCQLWNPHLEQFNVRMMPRAEFLQLVNYGVECSVAKLGYGIR